MSSRACLERRLSKQRTQRKETSENENEKEAKAAKGRPHKRETVSNCCQTQIPLETKRNRFKIKQYELFDQMQLDNLSKKRAIFTFTLSSSLSPEAVS